MRKKILTAVMILLSFWICSCKPGKEKLRKNISSNEEKLFNDSTKMLNDSTAAEVLKEYKEFAEKYPDDTMAPVYLFKSGDLSNGMRRYKEAIDLFTQFLKKYPDHRKAPVSLFMQAFITDNNLRDVEKAKMLYSEFLQKYPNHPLTPSAKASLDQLNMGLTDEQLIKMFEARQDSIARASK
jgi:TolA-binding protein